MHSRHYRKGKRLCYGTTQAGIQQSKSWGQETLKRNVIGYQRTTQARIQQSKSWGWKNSQDEYHWISRRDSP